ncbi:MAG: 4Fe-4S binding protein, partial [Adlercreutzia sp.]|nr:4Fe-4S binding protein [Adlercreutzia sp.]
MSSEVTRRQFCAAGGAAVVVAGLGGGGALARQNAQAVYLRPPGAASEAHLLARCDRCQRCVQACPYNLVQPRPLSWDFPTVGTPELIFREGYCD